MEKQSHPVLGISAERIEQSAPSVGSVLQEVLKGQEDDWVPYGPTSQKQQEET